MTALHYGPTLLVLTPALICFWIGRASEPMGPTDSVKLEADRLSCIVTNNTAWGDHQAGYNGIAVLLSPDCPVSPFVAAYAGLNLEFFYDSRPASTDRALRFEPRNHPMALTRLASRSAELFQAATPVSGVESRTRFDLKDPYYVDLTFTCIPRKTDLPGGFLGVFWASYIDDPENKSIYFLGNKSTLDKPFWVQFMAQQHVRDSTVVGEAAEDLPLDTKTRALWTDISPLRYSVPFFYGRFRNMVLVYIFKPGQGQEVRFAQSPTGGGNTRAGDGRNPAWDFHLVIPRYVGNRAYVLQARLIYKPWVGREDVLREVWQYLESPTDR
ncbi:MAG: hypothetical protein ACE15E_02960 [Acidobacteriota bacterium]